MVNFPARKVRATDIPPFALCVRSQDERALARAHQYSYSAHVCSFLRFDFLQGYSQVNSTTISVLAPRGHRSMLPTPFVTWVFQSRVRRSFRAPAFGHELGYKHDQASNGPTHEGTDGRSHQ